MKQNFDQIDCRF